MDLELQKTLFKLFEALEFPFYEGVFDVPFPYGTLTYTTVDRLNTKTSKGIEVMYQLNLFSDYNGTSEVKQMTNEVVLLLEKPFNVGEKKCALDSWNMRIQREDHIQHAILECIFKLY